MSVIDFMANCDLPECDQHMLEQEFNIKRSTTTVLIQRLVKKGLVEQHQSATDRRQKVISLTDKGRKLAPTVRQYITAKEKAIKDSFSADEVKHFMKILNFIIEEGKND